MKYYALFFALSMMLISFFIFYYQTQEPTGSFFAAILSAGLAFVSFVMLRWLVQVFSK